MPSTHTADFQTAALKATDLEAVEKINVGLETELARKQLNIIADAPEIRIQDKIGSAPENNETTMAIVADGGTTHFRAGIDTFAEGTETKGNVKFQSSTGATTHAEIVGSSGTLELQDGGLGLKLGSNVSVTGTSKVIQEITGPHARESAVLKKYPEVSFADGKFESNPTTNTFVQAGYTFIPSSSLNPTDWPGDELFDGHIGGGSGWLSENSYYVTPLSSAPTLPNASPSAPIGEYVTIGMPKKIRLSHMRIAPLQGTYTTNAPAAGKIYGGLNGTNWTEIGSFSGFTYTTGQYNSINTTSSVYYSHFALVVTAITNPTNGTWLGIGEWELYGYEEVGAGDDSVDTTVKSVYNAPDLTSAALYIDGKKSGSTPTDYGGSGITVTDNGTWDSSDNTWALSGATTSNLVSTDLGFVGDQPHSVSAWVKADQLNGGGLFHLGTADGAGDAASRVGFVDDSHISWGGEDHFFSNAEWHNVTYAYNGEGSDKKLYLDGRLVGSAKNEDTFGDYPPFAMSDYSQYGYTVSASSEYSGDYPVWEAFNKTRVDNGDTWLSGNAQNYNGGSGAYSGSANLGSDSGGAAFANADKGEWLKMEMPHKLVLDYIDICGSTSTNVNPKDWKIYGSNDDKNWDVLLSKTNSVTAAFDASAGRTHAVSATRAYKFFALVVTRTNGYTYYTQVCELQFYGHRENDLVRFPDSVNTLKYPHVAMTGPAQRGYAVTVSTQSTDSSTDPWRAFDGDTNTFWKTLESFNNGVYQQSNKLTSSLWYPATDHDGEYIILETPHKIQLSKVEINAQNSSRQPNSIAILGSNNGSATTGWGLLAQQTSTTYASNETSITVSSATSFKYHALVVRSLLSSSGLHPLMIQELRFFGTEENSDVVARVGDFDGKVRNLRVYSTALSDARVQEIFDADKDEFGLAKSSVSVYRGHLGVGTTEPKAALTVMDETADLGEFPPRTMTAEETYMEGHGNFKVSGSHYNTNSSVYQPYMGFKRPISTSVWNENTWNTETASYSGSAGTSAIVVSGASLGGYEGEWLKLSLPYGVKLSGYQIMIKSNWEGYGPDDWVILGSNDDTTWHLIASVTAGGIPGGGLSSVPRTKDFVVETTKYYKHLALVCSKIASRFTSATENQLNFTGLRYFGTREQGASTLHNGELGLTRNLTTPRIGPPLDADDTPKRDRLVVEYNTTTNPIENGFIKNTSGLNGNSGTGTYINGKMWGGAGLPTYDSAEKAISLTAPYEAFSSQLPPSLSGNHPYSFSIWVKPDTIQSGIVTICDMGSRSTNQSCGLEVNGGVIVHNAFDTNLQTSTSITVGQWTHIVGTYVSGSRRVYANGVLIGTDTYSSLDITHSPWNVSITVGANRDLVQGFDGSISQFKLYDVTLATGEVKRLYDMGRCDEGHHTTHVYKSKLQMRGENLVIEPCIRGFYEEGRWTPLIGGRTSGRKTPDSNNYGWFIRVGNLVTIGGTVSWSGGDSTLSGNVILDGLPFASNTTTNTRSAMSFGVVGSGITTGSGYNVLRLVLDPGYSFIWFIQANEHGSTTVTYNHNPGVASSGRIYGIGGSYMI